MDIKKSFADSISEEIAESKASSIIKSTAREDNPTSFRPAELPTRKRPQLSIEIDEARAREWKGFAGANGITLTSLVTTAVIDLMRRMKEGERFDFMAYKIKR